MSHGVRITDYRVRREKSVRMSTDDSQYGVTGTDALIVG